MSNGFFTYSENGSIARITLDMEDRPVNLLSMEMMMQLDQQLSQLESRSNLSLLVIESAKPGIFVAGADINQIRGIRDEEMAFEKGLMGQRILNRLECLSFPSLAYINGACMGGGTELALACTFRVVGDHPAVRISLPEVTLGIMPGWGGTQRLPRLIDLPQALSMILTGSAMDARKAEKTGLADRMIPAGYLDFFINDFARHCTDALPALLGRRHLPGVIPSAEHDGYGAYINSARAWQKKLRSAMYANIRLVRRGKIQKPKRGWFLNTCRIGRALTIAAARKQVLAKTHGNYPAPLVAIEVIRTTLGGNFSKGLIREARGFARLSVTEVCKNLIRIYFLSEQSKKLPESATDTPDAAGKVQQVGVLGAGVMGGAIAWLFADKGYPVTLKDIAWPAVQKGWDSAKRIYDTLKKKRRVDDRKISLGMHRINGTLDYAGLIRADVVVEAVVEKLEVKQTVLAEVEKSITPNTILASNTSSLSISEIGGALTHPERFAGMHFFNPVNRMPLVEIISGEKTSPETAVSLARLALKLKKTPVFVKDGPGFLVNRILMPYLNEAAHLLGEGADIVEIDRIWKSWGMPMGPCTLIDEIGIDVACHVANILEAAFPQRMTAAPLLRKLQGTQMLGKKNGQGFYRYGAKSEVNPAMVKILKDLKGSLRRPGADDIINRPLVMMINEAILSLDEAVVSSEGMLDLALIFGIGYPPFRGGLMRTAESMGAERIGELAAKFSREIDPRFTAAPGLSTRLTSGGTL